MSKFLQNILLARARDVQEKILPRIGASSITVFLCGKRYDGKDGLRERIRKELSSKKYGTWIDVYYPEDIFDEIMQSRGDLDLLNLENLLARSVHCIIIIVEGPGAIAELGAFSNAAELKDKLIVILDKKYKKKKSFINMGPIKALKHTKSHVQYLDFENIKDIPSFSAWLSNPARYALKPGDIQVWLEQSRFIGSELRALVRKATKGATPPVKDLSNPIYAQNFILACLYIFEELSEKSMNDILVEFGKSGTNNDLSQQVVLSTAKNILISHKAIVLHNRRYQLSVSGLARLQKLISLERDKQEILNELDFIRIDYLNSAYRKGNYCKIKEGRHADLDGNV